MSNYSIVTRSKQDLSQHRIADIIAKNIESTFYRRKPRHVLLFDLESFKLSDNFVSKNNDKWLPHQFAWTVYKYCFSKKKLTPIVERNYYVSEFWIDPLYRKEMSLTSNQSITIHLNELKKSRYPMKCGLDIIGEMISDMKQYNMEYICAYNIASDFQAIKNLYQHLFLSFQEKPFDDMEFDCNRSNPFNTNYVDLMHNVSEMYKDYLIEEGFKDGKIFRNAKTKRIKLRGRDNTKSIYSVEYIARKFFDKKQLHFASDDVIIEGMLLQKFIRDHGYFKLKLNSTYPTDVYRMFLQRILENYSDRIETHFMNSETTSEPTTYQSFNKIDENNINENIIDEKNKIIENNNLFGFCEHH